MDYQSLVAIAYEDDSIDRCTCRMISRNGAVIDLVVDTDGSRCTITDVCVILASTTPKKVA